MAENAALPLPQPTALSRPFWDACRRGELIVQRCRACGHYIFIPEPVCANCFSADLEWVPSNGRGTLYSYTVVWRPQQPAFPVPYIVAIIEMEEGWYPLTNLIECAPEDVRIGMPVKVQFQPVSEEITLPMFRPV